MPVRRWFGGRAAALAALTPSALRFLPPDLDPRQVEALCALVTGAGFSPDAYRAQSPALGAAVPDARTAVLHLLSFCGDEQVTYPLRLDPTGLDTLTRSRLWHRRGRARLAASLVNAHLAQRPDVVADPDFWAEILPALARVGRPYLLVGDSHSRLYRRVGLQRSGPILPIHVLCTAGSAAGLDNPASRSGYGARLARLADALARVPAARGLPILFQFGQVDIEFVAAFRRIANGEHAFDETGFETFCDRTAAAYGAFLVRWFSGLGPVHVLSVFPPALSDESWADGYCNAHVLALEDAAGDRTATAAAVAALEVPSLAERTRLHRAFNDRLSALCAREGFGFVALFDALLGPDGTVAPRFIAGAGGRDHHLDEAPLRAPTRAALEAALGRRQGMMQGMVDRMMDQMRRIVRVATA